MTKTVILVLSGDNKRAITAAKAYKRNPGSVVVASLSPHPGDRGMIDRLVLEGVPREDIYIDNRATTTVTNFTRTVRVLSRLKAERVVLVTGRRHMDRAKAIARVYWKYRSWTWYAFTHRGPVVLDPEPSWWTTRDRGIALWYRVTGSKQ